MPSRIIANGKLARILLCNGTATIVDAADVDLVKHLHWYPNSSKSKGVHYARANIPRDRTNGAVVTVLLHRLILGLPPGRVPNVDHANGNGLDNRRANIRVATAAQNKWNTGSRHTPKRTSRHKGVYFDRREGKWQAAIRVGACRKYLGTFRNEEAAVKAVREYTAVIHGEFAFERRTEGSATKTERVM